MHQVSDHVSQVLIDLVWRVEFGEVSNFAEPWNLLRDFDNMVLTFVFAPLSAVCVILARDPKHRLAHALAQFKRLPVRFRQIDVRGDGKPRCILYGRFNRNILPERK